MIGIAIAGPIAEFVFEPLLAWDGILAGSVGRIIGTGPGRGIGLLFILVGFLIIILSIIGSAQPAVKKLKQAFIIE